MPQERDLTVRKNVKIFVQNLLTKGVFGIIIRGCEKQIKYIRDLTSYPKDQH